VYAIDTPKMPASGARSKMNSPSEAVLAPASQAVGQAREPRDSADDDARRGHGLSLIFFLLEQSKLTLLMIPTLLAVVATWLAGGDPMVFALAWLAVPLFGVVLPLMYLVLRSHMHDAGEAHWEPYIAFRDPAEAARWRGKKIPMERVYEAYIGGRLDFAQDVLQVMLRRNQLFRFCFTWGDVKFYFKDFLRQNLSHSLASDRADIAPVYDRGNDFYQWFLGDGMVYTGAVFQDPEETLEVAQQRKLDLICRSTQMKPGDRHLDIGCGWGPLITHAAQHYGTRSTGITLAKEQAEWAIERARKAGVSEQVSVIVDDYRKLPRERYDKITCVEMAEHVGIRNFQEFLCQVRGMLKDDGVFYLQIAGLRRAWQYEDFVWGLFMGKYVFPGADASCPLGFVVSQAERAGFEVHRVENCGVHYGLTIRKWYDNWQRNREAVVAKYGEAWFRKWTMFLAWSALIGAQGSSTVFMITLAKNTKNDKLSVGPEEAAQVAYSRTERWVGKAPIATQQ
jgi:cyclopropane fatty-acyl-phospholipid synthase-like methyltransferase